MKILFTICGRKGSKGFKNKNLKEMNGIPLVIYTIAAIRLYCNKHLEDEVVVALNTDSLELKEIVTRQRIVENIICVSRKPEMAGDRVAKIDVIKDTFLIVRKTQDDFDVVVDLDITSPLRTETDIENAIRKIRSNQEYDLVCSVVEARRSPYFNMVEERDGFYHKICPSNYTARQEAPRSYELNASIYAYSPGFLMKEMNNTILDNKCGIVVMDDYLVLDIDSENDFVMMEMLHKYYCEKDEGLKKVYLVAKGY